RSTDDIIRIAIRAHGGKERLSCFQTLFTRTKAVIVVRGHRITVASDTWHQYPDRLKRVSHYESNGERHTETQVLSGDRGWLIRDGEKRELTAQERKFAKASLIQLAFVNLYPLLEDSRFNIASVGHKKVAGRDCVGVKVAVKG